LKLDPVNPYTNDLIRLGYNRA